MTRWFPTYGTVLPLSYFTYTNHAVKYEKLLLINITFCLEIPQKQQKENLKK